MSYQSWVETLVNETVAGTAFNTFTTAKTVLPTNSLYTLPAGYFTVGRMLNIRVCGAISNIVTTPGTIVFQVMLGSVIAFTTGTMQMSTTAHTNLPFVLDIDLTCRAVGSSTSANLMGQAVMMSQTVSVSGADATTGHAILLAPNTAPAVGTGFDSTTSQVIDLWCGFSISNAANQVTLHQYRVTSLN